MQIWDEKVSLGQLIGSNRDFIEAYIPHIGTLLRSQLNNILTHADVVVLGSTSITREELIKRLRDEQPLIDVTNLTPVLREVAAIAAQA